MAGEETGGGGSMAGDESEGRGSMAGAHSWRGQLSRSTARPADEQPTLEIH